MVVKQSRNSPDRSSGGKSSMVIDLPKTSFEPGESIEGVVRLRLGKPTKSKGVSIMLTSSESRRVQKIRNGKREPVTQYYTKIWHSVTLDVEKEYPADELLEYPFKLMTPSLTASYDPLSSLVKWIIKDKLPTGAKYKQFKVDAKLDISVGFDVNSNISVSVGLNPNWDSF